MEDKLKEFREMLLDKDYPLGIDEILGQVQYLFEDDKEVSHIVPTKIKLKDNEIKEEVKDSWATDIFKLSETYTVFLKLHKD